VGLLSRLRAAVNGFREPDPKVRPPGNFSPGSNLLSGPSFTDAFKSRRGPSPWQLVEKYTSLIYAMVARNRNAVARLPLRLYADGSRAQGGPPQRHSDPIRVTRSVGERLARDGLVSPSAVTKVYEIRTHPLLTTLDRPDPYGYFTREKLLGLMVSYCDVVGSAYLVPEGNGWRQPGATAKGPPDYLWVLYAQHVLPIRTAGSPLISKFNYFAESLPFDQVLWFRQNTSLRDPYGAGYSPTYAGDVYADQEGRSIALLDQVLGMGPKPSMIATAKDPMMQPSDEDARRLEQDMVRKHSAGMAGGILVNRGAWDFQQANWSPADMAHKELGEYDLYRLASIFDQPPTYYTVDSNLANLQAADTQHARQGIEPRCKAIAGTLTNMVQQWDPRLFLAFDPALPEDEESKQRVVDMRLKAGQTTINQENEDGRWPPVPWGDAPWIPGTLKQPDMITAEHEQGLKQAEAQIENETTATQFQFGPEGETESDSEARSLPVDRMIDRALERLEAELKRRAG